MVGDLKHGRTVHSLAKSLTMYSDSMFCYSVFFNLKVKASIILYF